MIILTHGYDWSVLKGKYAHVLGSSGKVKIGNNVFIGVNTTILKGVTIGNNVIIGACSLVNKDIPDDCVAAGNPVKVICSIEDYYKKRIEKQESEAIELVKEYRAVYKKDPSEKELSEFIWLFSDGTGQLDESWKRQLSHVGTEKESYKLLSQNEKKYNSMQDFFDSII